MGRLHQATRPDDAVDQLLLAFWPAADVVRLGCGGGNRLAAGETAVVKLLDCSAGDRERQDAAFPCARTSGSGLHPGIACPCFHVPLLMLMTHVLDLQFGDRIVTLIDRKSTRLNSSHLGI